MLSLFTHHVAPGDAGGGGDDYVLESPHPYADNANLYTPVRMRGAAKLLISFDERTNTEAVCDFVKFFKDDRRNALWGDERYSGAGASGNWPGLGGRPPLEIPGDSFLFHFHSDGSITRWGYKIRVHAVLPGAAGSSSSSASALVPDGATVFGALPPTTGTRFASSTAVMILDSPVSAAGQVTGLILRMSRNKPPAGPEFEARAYSVSGSGKEFRATLRRKQAFRVDMGRLGVDQFCALSPPMSCVRGEYLAIVSKTGKIGTVSLVSECVNKFRCACARASVCMTAQVFLCLT